MTVRQIILYTHASQISYKRMKAKMDAEDKKKKKPITADEVIFRGKPLSQLDSNEMVQYYSGDDVDHLFGPVTFL